MDVNIFFNIHRHKEQTISRTKNIYQKLLHVMNEYHIVKMIDICRSRWTSSYFRHKETSRTKNKNLILVGVSYSTK